MSASVAQNMDSRWLNPQSWKEIHADIVPRGKVLFGAPDAPPRAEVESFVADCGFWFMSVCDALGLFELYSHEYVTALAEVLRPYAPVLEVGAGDGRLSEHLRRAGVAAIGSDDDSWFAESSRFRMVKRWPVVTRGYVDAIREIRPQCIISSWMPLGDNWTPSFRRSSSVKAYVLIGEENGCCGSDKMFDVRPGWTRRDPHVGSQVCRADLPMLPPVMGLMRHSTTAMFYRTKES